jgi:hypothetical protein
VSTLEIDFLRRRGYGARSGDPVSISEAVSSLLADLVLEATAGMTRDEAILRCASAMVLNDDDEPQLPDPARRADY